MNEMLLGISPEYLYFHGKAPKHVSDLHEPYFLAFCQKERSIDAARKELIKKVDENKLEDNTLSKI